MGGVCGTYGRQEMWKKRLSWGDPREGHNLEYQGVDGRIILQCIFKT